VRAPFRHMGGKAKLVKYLLPLIPEHVCYVEPFGGAASLLFAKEPSPIEAINDVNGDLVNFMRVLQRKPWELVARLMWQPYSRAERGRERMGGGGSVARAARWYFLKQGSFGGKGPGNGLAVGMTLHARRHPEDGSQNPARSFARHVADLAGRAWRLREVVIESLDALEVVRRYDRPTTFFYVDPPYVNGTGAWPEAEHRRLAEALSGIKGKALVNYYDAPLVRELYGGWRVEAIANPAVNVEGRRGPRRRDSLLAIRNYPLGGEE